MTQPTAASFDFLSSALTLRAERQRLIASNIANADTPGYAAREFDFGDALRNATGAQGSGGTRGATLVGTHPAHQLTAAGQSNSPAAGYEVSTQPSLDGNSVDLDRERGKFTDNAIRYESTLRFINSHVRTMLSAIQGQ